MSEVEKNEEDAPFGTETILVVEDLDAVRRVACEMLALQGYQILEARNGVEALEVYHTHASRIDLIFTDIIMPEMDGGELAEEVWKINPKMKILFGSGYPRNHQFEKIMSGRVVKFIAKPYNRLALSRKIREVMDGGSRIIEWLKETGAKKP